MTFLKSQRWPKKLLKDSTCSLLPKLEWKQVLEGLQAQECRMLQQEPMCKALVLAQVQVWVVHRRQGSLQSAQHFPWLISRNFHQKRLHRWTLLETIWTWNTNSLEPKIRRRYYPCSL
jgi:hypothetical protein